MLEWEEIFDEKEIEENDMIIDFIEMIYEEYSEYDCILSKVDCEPTVVDLQIFIKGQQVIITASYETEDNIYCVVSLHDYSGPPECYLRELPDYQDFTIRELADCTIDFINDFVNERICILSFGNLSFKDMTSYPLYCKDFGKIKVNELYNIYKEECTIYQEDRTYYTALPEKNIECLWVGFYNHFHDFAIKIFKI